MQLIDSLLHIDLFKVSERSCFTLITVIMQFSTPPPPKKKKIPNPLPIEKLTSLTIQSTLQNKNFLILPNIFFSRNFNPFPPSIMEGRGGVCHGISATAMN